MAIPIIYNLRNLAVRKTTTIMTALGIACTIAVLLTVLGLLRGLNTALNATADPLNIVVLRKGSETELVSNLQRRQFQDAKFKSGIGMNSLGHPLASLELVTIINIASVDAPDGTNVTVRGLEPVGVEVRDGIKLLKGRWFETGKREVVVGKSIASRFPEAQLGGRLQFGSGYWDVVGVMESGESVTNSEIFADLNLLSGDFHRVQVLSSVVVRAANESEVQPLIDGLNNDQRLNVTAVTAAEYYQKQQSSGKPIQLLGLFVSIVMAVGSSFAAMNTMYAAVARRSAEIGTLRVLGFSRASILTSFVVESVLLSGIGGLLGCLIAYSANGITTGVGNFATFSEVAFSIQITPGIMVSGVLFSMLLGLIGGVFPAAAAARKEVVAALRAT